jgi:putative PEP-CTERM system TPR-repeat lipoprotein
MNNLCRKLLYPVLLLVIFSCSSAKDNEQLLIEAKALISQNENSEAVIHLKNILQNAPEHSEARYLLGKIYLSVDDYLGAEKELRRSVRRNPENYQAILLLAKAQFSLSQFDNVIDTLSNIEFISNEDQAYALVLIGQSYLSTNRLNLAKESINEASNISIDFPYSILGKALIAAYEDNNTEALSHLNLILEKDNKFDKALLLKGSVLSKIKRYQEAAEAYLAYFNLKPVNFGIRTLIAHNYIKAGNFDAAKSHIDALTKINDNHPTTNVLAAQIKYYEEDYRAANELASKVVNVTNNGLAQMILGLSSFQLNDYEQAYYQLNAISDLIPKEHKVNKVLALLQVKLGYTDELNETLEQFSENLAADDASLYASIGREMANKGDNKSAQEMFNKASDLAPDNATIIAQLGILKLANTDKSGVNELKKAIKLDPNFKGANIALAMNYLKEDNITEAERIADEWLKVNPKNAAAIILRGNIAVKSKNTEDAIKYFNQALVLDPESITPLFNLAVITAEKEQYKDSNTYLDKLFSIDLEYPYAYRLAISNALQLNAENELEDKIFSLIEKSPEAIWPRVILARRLVIRNDSLKAISLLEALNNQQNLPIFYFKTLSDALVASKNYDKLTEMYNQWQASQPSNPAAFLNYIDILQKNKNYKLALDITQKALSQEGLKSNFQFLSLEAYFLLATNQLELALTKANKLAVIKPGHAFVLRVQGEIALAQEDFIKAIDYFSRSLASNNKTTTRIYLATAYRDNGQIKEAIQLLEKELRSYPGNQAYIRFLTELYVLDSPKSAIKNYEKILEKNPKDVVALNNIAWSYLEKNNLKQALIFSEKAKVLAPNHPQILDTYGLILTKNNRPAEAIAALSLANSLSPKNKEARSLLTDISAETVEQKEKKQRLLK